MDAIPEFAYEIEHNPKPEKIDTIEVYATLVIPANLEPILIRSRLSCSLPTKEFIEDNESPHKQELFNFFTEAGADDYDASMLIVKLIELVFDITSSVIYCSHYALSLWVTLYVVPSGQDSVLDDPQLTEEAVRASLDDYENVRVKPTSKLGVESLTTRRYERTRKTISVSGHKRKQKTDDRCTICLKDFKTGRKVGILPCGHEFDNKCIVKWLKVNHVCPLCRFELPCEDNELSQTTMAFERI